MKACHPIIVALVGLGLAGGCKHGSRDEPKARDDEGKALAGGPGGQQACEAMRDWYLRDSAGDLGRIEACRKALTDHFVDVCMEDEPMRRCAERGAEGLTEMGGEPNVDEGCGMVLVLGLQRVLTRDEQPHAFDPPPDQESPSGTPEERRACGQVRDWLREVTLDELAGDDAEGIRKLYERAFDEHYVDVCLSSPRIRRCAIALAPELVGGAEADPATAGCADVLDETLVRALNEAMRNPPQ